VDNIAERVRSFGMESTAIFGNDAMQVHRTLKEAVERARHGGGATFVEAYTYRWSGHYGPASDDLVGYRAAEDLEAWKRNCPLTLLRAALQQAGSLTDAEDAALTKGFEDEIAASFHFAKSSPFPVAPDWHPLNLATATPQADRLLADVEAGDFDAHQELVQAKGY
jgi:pyruvate dehydrogenase E1 component alpha subunit